MSRENVEMVRSAFEAFARQDMDTALKAAAPDFALDLSQAFGMDRGIYDADQWRRLVAEFAGTWESVRWELDELIDAGDHVLTPFTNELLGRDGIKLTARGFWVWTIRDGAIARICLYQERQAALEAVGLRA
jgi:ketosteroid isomerase-like protein